MYGEVGRNPPPQHILCKSIRLPRASGLGGRCRSRPNLDFFSTSAYSAGRMKPSRRVHTEESRAAGCPRGVRGASPCFVTERPPSSRSVHSICAVLFCGLRPASSTRQQHETLESGFPWNENIRSPSYTVSSLEYTGSAAGTVLQWLYL